MTERDGGRAALAAGLALTVLFCLPSMLPIAATALLLSDGSLTSIGSVDWGASLEHSLAVAGVASLSGAWAAVAAQNGVRPPWRLLSLWLVLAALVPLSLLAQTLALTLGFTGGVGRSAVLFAGHVLAVVPVTFVLMVRRIALDGDAHYLALRNLGASAGRAHALLLLHRYPHEVALGTTLAFFVILNESVVAGSLGGDTAYFGAVMNAAALGSADPSNTIVGGIVELISITAVLLIGRATADPRV